MHKGFDVVNLHGTASGVIATPYIGENNNWWIGNEDTGISAKGTKGDPGCPGVQGPKGDKGDVGPAGPQGAQGASGPQGLKGDQGDIGPAGPQGLKGDQGLVGNDGIQGSKGDKGDTGPVGPQGPKGEDADVAELEKLKEDVVRIDSDLALKTGYPDYGNESVLSSSGSVMNGIIAKNGYLKAATNGEGSYIQVKINNSQYAELILGAGQSGIIPVSINDTWQIATRIGETHIWFLPCK